MLDPSSDSGRFITAPKPLPEQAISENSKYQSKSLTGERGF